MDIYNYFIPTRQKKESDIETVQYIRRMVFWKNGVQKKNDLHQRKEKT